MKSIEATAALAICESVSGESVSGESGFSSEMLTPPAMLRSGVNANFNNGVMVVLVSYGGGIPASSATAARVSSRQS